MSNYTLLVDDYAGERKFEFYSDYEGAYQEMRKQYSTVLDFLGIDQDDESSAGCWINRYGAQIDGYYPWAWKIKEENRELFGNYNELTDFLYRSIEHTLWDNKTEVQQAYCIAYKDRCGEELRETRHILYHGKTLGLVVLIGDRKFKIVIKEDS